METFAWTDAGSHVVRETPVEQRIADLEQQRDALRFEVTTLHAVLDDVVQRVVALSKKPDPEPDLDPEPALFCESCGQHVGRYWHGLRKTLCRRCAEEAGYAQAHPWRVRAQRAAKAVLLVGAIAVPGALVAILYRIL